MKRIIMFTAMSLFMIGASAGEKVDEGAAEPKELVAARTAYQNQIRSITDPINKKYLQQLEVLKKQLGGKGDIKGASAVEEEISDVSGEEDGGAGEKGDAAARKGDNKADKKKFESGMDAKEFKIPRNITIPATFEGFKILNLKKGMTISIAYKSGEWSINEDIGMLNPSKRYPQESRIYLYGVSVCYSIENEKWRNMGASPYRELMRIDTLRTSHECTFGKDYDSIVITVGEALYGERKCKDNKGEVTVKVKIK